MSASPFTTIEEFNNVLDGPTEGAIYTFAQSPAINMIALLVSVGIFIWFIAATYSTHASPTSSMDKSLNQLSSFIIVSLLSVVAANQHFTNRPSGPAADELTAQNNLTERAVYKQTSRSPVPLGLLGLVGAGLPQLRRLSKRKGRRKRGLPAASQYRPRR